MNHAISAKIGKYLNRTIEKGTYTEYFDSRVDQLVYWPKATPIESITSIFSDPDGVYTSPNEESDYYIGKDDNSVVLDSSVTPSRKGLRIIYVGGLAATGTQSTFVVNSAITVAKYIQGSTSGAVGYVTTGGTTIVVDVLLGKFEVGETITEYNTLDNTSGLATSGNSAVISSVSIRSLAESYPDIATAAEYEIRFHDKHKSDFEVTGTSPKTGTNRRQYQFGVADVSYELQPETISLLRPYRRLAI